MSQIAEMIPFEDCPFETSGDELEDTMNMTIALAKADDGRRTSSKKKR